MILPDEPPAEEYVLILTIHYLGIGPLKMTFHNTRVRSFDKPYTRYNHVYHRPDHGTPVHIFCRPIFLNLTRKRPFPRLHSDAPGPKLEGIFQRHRAAMMALPDDIALQTSSHWFRL